MLAVNLAVNLALDLMGCDEQGFHRSTQQDMPRIDGERAEERWMLRFDGEYVPPPASVITVNYTIAGG